MIRSMHALPKAWAQDIAEEDPASDCDENSPAPMTAHERLVGSHQQSAEQGRIGGRKRLRGKARSHAYNVFARYLRRQVGRPVDAVFSEILKRPDILPVGLYKRQGLQHFFNNWVEPKVTLDPDGTVRHRNTILASSRKSPRYYVHPETRLISLAPLHRVQRHPRFVMTIRVAPEQELHYRNGIWYWAEFGLLEEQFAYEGTIHYARPKRGIIGWRQASHEDLRQYNLVNFQDLSDPAKRVLREIFPNHQPGLNIWIAKNFTSHPPHAYLEANREAFDELIRGHFVSEAKSGANITFRLSEIGAESPLGA